MHIVSFYIYIIYHYIQLNCDLRNILRWHLVILLYTIELRSAHYIALTYLFIIRHTREYKTNTIQSSTCSVCKDMFKYIVASYLDHTGYLEIRYIIRSKAKHKWWWCKNLNINRSRRRLYMKIRMKQQSF